LPVTVSALNVQVNAFTISRCYMITLFPSPTVSVIVLHTTTTTIYGPLFETTWVSQYQKKRSPSHTYSDYQPSFISFL